MKFFPAGEYNSVKFSFIKWNDAGFKAKHKQQGIPQKPRSTETALLVWHHNSVLNELRPDCKLLWIKKAPPKYQLIIKTLSPFKTQGHCGPYLTNLPLKYSHNEEVSAISLNKQDEFVLTVVTFLLIFSSRFSCPRTKYGCWNSVSSFSGFTSPPCSMWTTFRKPSTRQTLKCVIITNSVT